MKLINVIIGVVLFCVVVTFMFKFTYELGNQYNSDDAATYQELSSNYDNLGNLTTREDTSLGNGLQDKIDNAVVDAILGSVRAGVEGGKIMVDSVDTTNKVVDQVASDTGFESVNIFANAIKGIIVLLVTISIIFFFWRFKAET